MIPMLHMSNWGTEESHSTDKSLDLGLCVSLLLQLRYRKASGNLWCCCAAQQGLNGPITELGLWFNLRQNVGIPLSWHPPRLILFNISSSTSVKVLFKAPSPRIFVFNVLNAGILFPLNSQCSTGPRSHLVSALPCQLPDAQCGIFSSNLNKLSVGYCPKLSTKYKAALPIRG